MPFRDGTGRGMGRGGGRDGMRGNRQVTGPAGNCVCSSCGKKVTHQAGVTCYSINCPQCGNKMIKA